MNRPIAVVAAVFVAWTMACTAARAADAKIAVVAAENFYGDVARQIGGNHVSITSILDNPDQDPHLFETTPSTVRKISAARIVIYNGAGYDSWMPNLLAANPQEGRTILSAADLVHEAAGDNPHLWYDPATIPALAKALAAALSSADPADRDEYAARLDAFLDSLAPINRQIASIRARYAGAPVAATEPVFGYMAAALGLKMHDSGFQRAVMNNTEPSARDLAAFEQELRMRQVHVLFFNKQASDNLVRHLVGLARASNVPVVGVTETAPPDASYQSWILNELEATEKALDGAGS